MDSEISLPAKSTCSSGNRSDSIEEFYPEKIDLDDLAKYIHVSLHYIRVFKQVYDDTWNYLKDMRISKAPESLEAGPFCPDVCMSVGYESLATFSATFNSYRLLPRGINVLYKENLEITFDLNAPAELQPRHLPPTPRSITCYLMAKT
ncbi:AraC family transcriptional regulator [Vibrio lentus]|nr:AraC family transcriptional regulator [Vibrio lentus]